MLCTFVLIIGFLGWLSYETLKNNTNYHLFPLGNRLNPNGSNNHQITPNKVVNLSQLLGQSDEYVESKNFVDWLYDSISAINLVLGVSYAHEYLRPHELLQSGNPSLRNDTICGQQLEWILTKLNENPDYMELKGKLGRELTGLLDAFGYQQSGFMTEGSKYWIGSADKCSKLSLNLGQIKTHHCYANFKFNSWTKPDVHYTQTELHIGFCIPRTCDTMSFSSHITKFERLSKYHLSNSLKKGLKINSLFCIPDEESPIRQLSIGGLVYLGLVGFWLALVVLATLINELNLTQISLFVLGPKGSTLLDSLNLRKSIKTLKSAAPYADDKIIRVDLRILDFIRIIMIVLIVQLHCGLLSTFLTTKFLPIALIIKSKFALIFLSCGLFIDTFMVIFGMLLSYKLLCRFKPNQIIKPPVWLMVNLNIALRVCPIFVLTYWFNALIMPQLGSGPLWDYGVDNSTTSGMCKIANWWQSIPHVSNVGKYPLPACNSPGWFLGAYTQIALLMPLLIYMLAEYKHEISRILLVIFVASISCVNVGIKMYQQQVISADALADYGGFLVVLIEKYEASGYMDTLSRFGTVTIGALLGYYLYKYEIGHLDTIPKWLASKRSNIILVTLHLIIFFSPLIGNIIAKVLSHRTQITMIQFAAINGFVMLIWPTINCLLLFNVATTIRNNSLLKFMNHPLWHTFNKLGLCLFLVHMGVANYILTFDEDTLPSPTYANIGRICLQVTFVSLILALLVYILFEAPLLNIITCLFTHSPITDKSKSLHTSGNKSIESSGQNNIEYSDKNHNVLDVQQQQVV